MKYGQNVPYLVALHDSKSYNNPDMEGKQEVKRLKGRGGEVEGLEGEGGGRVKGGERRGRGRGKGDGGGWKD